MSFFLHTNYHLFSYRVLNMSDRFPHITSTLILLNGFKALFNSKYNNDLGILVKDIPKTALVFTPRFYLGRT